MNSVRNEAEGISIDLLVNPAARPVRVRLQFRAHQVLHGRDPAGVQCSVPQQRGVRIKPLTDMSLGEVAHLHNILLPGLLVVDLDLSIDGTKATELVLELPGLVGSDTFSCVVMEGGEDGSDKALVIPVPCSSMLEL